MSNTENLFESFLPACNRYASEARRINPALAARYTHEELYGEAMVMVWTAIEEFDPDAGMKLSTYVIQRIRWRMMDLSSSLRAEAKRTKGSFSIDQCGREGESGFDLPYDQVWNLDNEDEAYRLLDTLSARDYRIFTLRFMDGMDWTEIADEMGMTVSGANMRYQRAIEKLKEQVQ